MKSGRETIEELAEEVRETACEAELEGVMESPAAEPRSYISEPFEEK